MKIKVMGSNKPILRSKKGYSKVQHLIRAGKIKAVKANGVSDYSTNPPLKDCLGYYDRALKRWVFRYFSKEDCWTH